MNEAPPTLPCEDCGTPNPLAHQYCHHCGNYLQDDAIKLPQLPAEMQAALRNLEQRLQPAQLRRRHQRQIVAVAWSYLAIAFGYAALKILAPQSGYIEYIFLFLRLAEIALPAYLAARIEHKGAKILTFALIAALTTLLLYFNLF